ncbi:MAG: CHAT domain-containing protein, partial [Gemmatimonadaceae bacterium]
PELETLPWEWTLVEGEHLSIRWPVVRAPVGVSESARGHPSVRWPPRALFIGDPRGPTSPSLPGALKEVEDIGRLYDAGTRTILVGGDDDESRGAAPRRGRRRPRPATYANVMAELRGGAYDIVHFAGHAWFDASESFLELHDGLVWTNELRTLLSPHPPAVLVLNSHYTAFVPPGVRTTEGAGGAAGSAGAAVNPAADPRGFVRMAGATGVGAFVGCFGTPLDEAAQHVGFTLHQRLLQGEPVAWALHRARQAGLAFGRARGDMTALLYTASGYPELRVSG